MSFTDENDLSEVHDVTGIVPKNSQNSFDNIENLE